MGKYKIIESEKRLDVGEIASFESNYGLKLPNNFKEYILKHNGGVFDPYEHPYVDTLLSIKYGAPKIESIYESLAVSEGILGKDELPIAVGYTGNPLILNLAKGENYGCIIVHYLDREGEPVKIADSLEELLDVESIDDL